ncbi:hypothetical protein CVIRNUC_010588 [Coccomyxa viridis]|uniref:Transmembrane protein 18 n=1 Tax=Coccomyxa viridis TaxID=1274662 RepID=A0AAV1IJ52_9CHLO|nr:hypothetical protein CVIRNUC_010588 [Coccomyxa viridis]
MAGSLDGLSAALDETFRDIREKFREAGKEAKIWESLQAFAAAVDWTEPWIIGVLATHCLLLVLVLVFRKNWNLNMIIMVAAAAAVYNAQRINSYLHRHWAAFARQPYFDEQGVFISALMSAPLLAIMLVQLVSYLILTSQMLVEMKVKELKYKARQKARGEKQAQQTNKKDS